MFFENNRFGTETPPPPPPIVRVPYVARNDLYTMISEYPETTVAEAISKINALNGFIVEERAILMRSIEMYARTPLLMGAMRLVEELHSRLTLGPVPRQYIEGPDFNPR